MISTLDDIVDRLITGYDPERIILFGSHAAGRADEGSDIDLLIVKDTAERPIDRRIQVERLLSDRRVALDLHVYTPQEIWDLYGAGSPFIEEVLETGRLVYMRKETAAWVKSVRDEFETAALLMDHGKYRGTCLHSQQCVEKALKALLLEKGSRPPRTHDLVELLNQVTAAGWQLSLDMDTAVFLNSIYRGRYPTDEGLLPYGEPRVEDAQRALDAADNMVQSLSNLLPEAAPEKPDDGSQSMEDQTKE